MGGELGYESPDDGTGQDGGYGAADDGGSGGSNWSTPDSVGADADQFSGAHPFGSADSLMSFDPAPPPALTHGGLDVPGLTLPASLTDPSAHPAPDPNSLPPSMFHPLPAEPHHHPSSIPEKVYDAVTHPSPPPAPPEDPTELERQREEKASQNAIGQHTPMGPEIPF